MMNQDDKYTPSVRKAIINARVVSESFGAAYVGSEQILYGLILCADSRASKILSKYGVTKSKYYQELKKEISVGFDRPGYTPNAKGVLEDATYIAYDAGLPYVATEHILLAILRSADCRACAILRRITENFSALEFDTEQVVYPERKPNRSGGFDVKVASLGDTKENNVGTAYTASGENGLKTSPSDSQHRLQAGAQSDARNYCEGSFGGEKPHKAQNSADYDKRQTVQGDLSEEGKAEDPLSRFGTDLTKKAKEGKLDPVIGRDKEIARLVQTLSRRTKNSPVLVGEAGVGKSAVVEGLALAIARGEVPDSIADKRIFSLDVSNLLAGASYRGEFEQRFLSAIDYVKNSGDVILFIDEIHNLIGTGASGEGKMDAAEILKPALARGEFQLIGATTYDEYRKYIEKDPALERRFQPVTVDPPSPSDAKIILKGLRDKYEAHHKVHITDEAISAAVDLSVRYIVDRNLPDKAIDVIDETAARARLKNSDFSSELNEKRAELNRVLSDREYYVREGYISEAKTAEQTAIALKKQIDDLQTGRIDKRSLVRPSVTADDVAAVISDMTNIPLTKIEKSESERLLNLEAELHARVIGQDEAVSAVAKAIRRARANLKDPKRPIGSFIFVGPTGVGKTELSKALAEAVFGDENALIRVDMSEYMDKASSSKLIGAAPGLVGYEEEGQLTGRVRKKPYSVVLFDEIEKAHPEIFDLMLQILDDGRLTDGKGKTVDFKNTVIIMTSNIGAGESQKVVPSFGFGNSEEIIEDHVYNELKKFFRPEFLNRVDDIVTFRKLTPQECGKILDLLLNALKKRLYEIGIELQFDESAKNEILKRGYDEEYGARPLKRVLRREVEDLLSDELISGKLRKGDSVMLYADEKTGAIRYALI